MTLACRFGITSVHGYDGYPLESLGVAAYLDWGASGNPDLPPGIEYIRVLRLRDDLYPQELAGLPALLAAHPGSLWVVGNEPDTTYGGQDDLLPEVYADRYYEMARIIRRSDRSARIAFGSIVQPTPIRIRYLERAWQRLVELAGSPAQASSLVDIWSIHSFILNENPGHWGTGIPRGFETDWGDAVIITDFADTYSISIFQARLVDIRTWMAGIGERDKELWITEYGSLFPPVDPPGGPDYENVSDELTTGFMLATFDFMLGAADDQTGLPADGNHLVQRWFWYSLNDHRYNFGGTLFDPDNGNLPTLVGGGFMDYQSTHLSPVDLLPTALSIAPVSYSPDRARVNYRLDISLDNKLFDDASCAQVWVYDGDPGAGGSLIAGPVPSSAIRRDFSQGKLSVYWMDVQPLTMHTLCVYVGPIQVVDTDPANNLACFEVFTALPRFVFLPLVGR